ncbi:MULTISPECIES: response regulator transcription factor [unclassified Bradyrhizobium]|uniref:response regulator transcription factor n=1 Tax=unclassified Bradyrhizobium TaxID=2631580 RepID=UPI002FEFA9B6
MAFRRATVESFLKLWARSENVVLVSLLPEDAHARIVAHDCDLLLFSVGCSSPSTSAILAEMQVLHALRPEAALAIFADDTSTASILAAMNSGARGYLANSMDPGLALQALSFVLHGGTYFPAVAIQAERSANMAASPGPDFSHDMPTERPPAVAPHQGGISIPRRERNGHSSIAHQPQGSLLYDQVPYLEFNGDIGDLPIVCSTLNISEPMLTSRQQAILRCLCRGDSNKVIARNCHIAESTVKIHVKSILRKIGAKNRTQAAILAIQRGLYAGPAEDIPNSETDSFGSDDEI